MLFKGIGGPLQAASRNPPLLRAEGGIGALRMGHRAEGFQAWPAGPHGGALGTRQRIWAESLPNSKVFALLGLT